MFLFLLLIFLVSNISAVCNSEQIDINTASAEELQNIIQIGPVRADEIIELRAERLFESIDDLVRVSGIVAGGSRLTQIKEEGLACVNEEGTEEIIEEILEEEPTITENNEETTESKTSSSNEQPSSEKEITYEPLAKETGPIELKMIDLNPKVIKSENGKEDLNKNNYAIYGFVFFSVLLGVLFILRNRYKKNEFR